jgi:hypothetical protein
MIIHANACLAAIQTEQLWRQDANGFERSPRSDGEREHHDKNDD